MREIKFRGLCISGKAWYYGLVSMPQVTAGPVKPGVYISNSKGMPFAYQVRPETLGQFTGLKDKNGVEIYEGDIIHNTEYPSEDWAKYVVSFDRGYFNMADLKYHCINVGIWNVHERCDIIGNIHDKETA